MGVFIEDGDVDLVERGYMCMVNEGACVGSSCKFFEASNGWEEIGCG